MIRVIKVSDDGLIANLYLPPSEGRHPAIIVISGSDGGIASAAMWGEPLAARGYAVLAAAYFALEHLPVDLVEIPLDRDRVGLLGHSRGGEGALLAAAIPVEQINGPILFMSGMRTASGPQRDDRLRDRAAAAASLPVPP
jgi:dienelactone hydrolase